MRTEKKNILRRWARGDKSMPSSGKSLRVSVVTSGKASTTLLVERARAIITACRVRAHCPLAKLAKCEEISSTQSDNLTISNRRGWAIERNRWETRQSAQRVVCRSTYVVEWYVEGIVDSMICRTSSVGSEGMVIVEGEGESGGSVEWSELGL